MLSFLLMEILPIRITCPCNVYPPYTPFLYSKTGVYRGIHFFLIFALKQRSRVLVRTASLREIFPSGLANLLNKLVHAHSFDFLICISLGKYFLYFKPTVDFEISIYVFSSEGKQNRRCLIRKRLDQKNGVVSSEKKKETYDAKRGKTMHSNIFSTERVR